MEPWVIWILAAIGFFIMEIFTPGFVLACLGAGCLLTGFISMTNTSATVQLGIFAVVTLVVFIGIRPFFMKYLYRKKDESRTNIEALIGKTGIVTEEIKPLFGQGRVKVGGEDWKAETLDGKPLTVEEKVCVERVEGIKVFVKRLEEEEEGV